LERIGHIRERFLERIGRIYPIELRRRSFGCKSEVKDKESSHE